MRYINPSSSIEEKSVLLATGSSDPYVYLYNIGEVRYSLVKHKLHEYFHRGIDRQFDPQNTAELMQRLEGHTDRVYAANFHPTEPILASCSADYTIKVWGPGTPRGKKKGII
jgi:COMPASS component SWD3